MIKKYKYHLIGWGLYIFYQYAGIKWDNLPYELVLTNTYIISAFVAFYFSYILIWTPVLRDRNYKRLLLIPIALMVFIGVRHVLEEILSPAIFGFGNYRNDEIVFYAQDNFWRSMVYTVAAFIAASFVQQFSLNSKLTSLKEEKANAEMSFLRSQLNPHFLFNSLSFIYTKAMKLDPELGDTVFKLSEMLRYSLESSKQDKVPIQKEIDLLENYINIFKNRFEGKFNCTFNIENGNGNIQIEPLLLIPFIENAFKHGITSDPDNPVLINLNYSKSHLHFNCKNKINNHHKDKGSGIGLENIKKRLDLLYANKYSLDIKNDGQFFETDLRIKL
ncbi:MAG: histidine kinase [Bacteroidota bacterium]